jgi:LysR family transcriptional activator of nhaA
MSRSINYKHLHYFWAVARWGGITRASERLHLSPQTLSGQIKQLEDSLGVALFVAVGKRLELTEAGRLAYSYADEMFSLGAELGEALQSLPDGRTQHFRVGIADAFPKSMTQRLLAPALTLSEPIRLICREGALETLLADLALHRLDFVLSIRPVPQGLNVRSFGHALGESAIGLFRARRHADAGAPFPQAMHGQPLLLPSEDSPLREALLAWCERKRVVPRIVGEFDDSALMKAFGAAGSGLFPAPLALRDEIERHYDSLLMGVADGVSQRYYAITNERRVSHPAVGAIIAAAGGVLSGTTADAGGAGSSKKAKMKA